jgi:hypothetical protein
VATRACSYLRSSWFGLGVPYTLPLSTFVCSRVGNQNEIGSEKNVFVFVLLLAFKRNGFIKYHDSPVHT